ncbi:toll/interleukin-1 receptor domain-containing protein [Streptomyces sp. NPDC007094]|uniref:toll/interleukin-1 receptor domain-containing protein n=1 Tax=Streptomyces sp. NPDC007094 TaxID=3155359 RepID=UPI00340F64B4
MRGGCALKIFISHGSGKDAEVVEALDIIAPVLDARGYDVFKDVEKLRTGQSWSPALYEEMYLCDAAIVLLGPNTIADSDWVRRESEVLMSRRFVRSLSTVLPCFLGTDKTKEARKRGFGALLTLQAELGQRVKNPLPEGEITRRIAQWVLDEFALVAGPPGDGAFFEWAKRIAAYLRVARERDPQALNEMAEALHCSTEDLLHVRASVGAEMFLAHVLFRAGEAVRLGQTSPLPTAVAALRPSLGSSRSGLAAELMSSWVDPVVAADFAPGAPQSGTPVPAPLIFFRAGGSWAAEQHIRRALCNAPRAFNHRALAAGGDLPMDESDAGEELLSACLDALQEVFDIPPGLSLSPGLVEPRPGCRDYLVINGRGYAYEDIAGAVNALHQDYPWLVIIVLQHELLPDQQQLNELDMGRAVRVDFSRATEMRAYSFMRSLEDVAGIAG